MIAVLVGFGIVAWLSCIGLAAHLLLTAFDPADVHATWKARAARATLAGILLGAVFSVTYAVITADYSTLS